jgi:hypothetical protein
MKAAALRPALRGAAGVLALCALAPLALTACGREEAGGGGGSGGADAGLAGNVQVQNVPGAGNTIALARLANQQGNAGMMQMMGLG